MCGIVGYVGPGSSLEVLMGGLKRLEYRGYDSAGVAVLDDSGHLGTRKKAGKLGKLSDELGATPIADGHTGIGHTRWATHGGPTDGNAHPHLGDDGKLALIHNGIIENFAELKRELLESGVTFTSETDTEVAALLVGKVFRETGDLTTALRRTVARLQGAFTLLAVHQDQPGVVVGARRNSPLVIGLGDGENFLGSDVAAFVEHTRRAMEIGQDQIVTIRPDSVEVTDFAGNPVPTREFEVAWDASAAEKGGWPTFMKKEISEEPEAVGKTLLGRIEAGAVKLPELDAVRDVLADADRIILIACGTASYASLVGKYAIEAWARIPVEVELSHEFRYRDPVLSPRTLVVSVSQSGETMDTLMAVQYAKAHGARTLSICNAQGATIPRESDAVLYTHAGPEVAVASTKAFVAQITALYLLGLHLAGLRGTLEPATIAELLEELQNIPAKLDQVVESSGERIAEFAKWMGDVQSVLFLGRHAGYPIALEGALKLKELAYIHAEGFAAGELKHGPIALIEPGQLVIVVVPSPRDPNSLHAKVVSNIQEIRARGARVIAIAELGDVEVLPFVDEVIRIPFAPPLFEPLLAVVPLHVFAMELATAKGLDVDQPRNLAKSVTVE
jgi:glucosamine--fructose-6-phosphate aminotransferase (isomerizing)